ncbi:MAG: dockerin type I repeat-containing protein [Deltaproteobacteria bacterium]|nr:dockerin type I repeat-containing protein [Deltaproteobacteria bacterium]
MGYNIIGNYYKRGLNDRIYPFCFWGTTSYYLRDNYIEGRAGDYTGLIQDPWAEADKVPGLKAYADRGKKAESETPVPPVTTHSPQEAYELVLEQAGCFPRDTLSRRTINEVRTGTGYWGRRDPGDLMAGLTPAKPPRDSDNDGMPDAWERANGLNPADSTDHNRVMSSGYTAIEEYCNVLAQGLIEHRGNLPPKGDLDGNGKINIFDLLALLRAIIDSETGWAADLNYDGKVDIFDLLEMLRSLKSRG